MTEFLESDMCKTGTKSDAKKALNAAVKTIRDIIRGASGRVPPLNLLRIWDSGASQGMTDRSQVASAALVKGKRITIHTGTGSVSSTMYESVVVAPGLAPTHVALPATANTVSIGSLNVQCQVGFQWLQPLSRTTGCSFGFQALLLPTLMLPLSTSYFLLPLLNLYLQILQSRVPFIMMAYLSFSLAELLQELLKESTRILF